MSSELVLLETTPAAMRLADTLLEKAAIPRNAYEDALHIAIAASTGMDYLLTWNCKHIANAFMIPRVNRVIRSFGFEPPLICTPSSSWKSDMRNDPIVEETRAARRELHDDFQGDTEAFFRYLKEIEANNAERLVKLDPKPAIPTNRTVS